MTIGTDQTSQAQLSLVSGKGRNLPKCPEAASVGITLTLVRRGTRRAPANSNQLQGQVAAWRRHETISAKVPVFHLPCFEGKDRHSPSQTYLSPRCNVT